MVKVVGAPGANGGTSANGGDGGAAVANDPETGAAATITASATAKGGAGGWGEGGFTPGTGGLANATASAANTKASGASTSYAYATGGVGGEGFRYKGVSSAGAIGGAAEAASTSVSLGAATAKATATGGAGGARSIHGNGADGGVAGATASATGRTANAVATAIGGNGGFGYENLQGYGYGDGGQAAASAVANGVTWAAATVDVTGGGGQNGATVTVTNAVSGATKGGTLILTQNATGGAGLMQGNVGGAQSGSASSSLTFDDTKSPTQSAKVKAIVNAVAGMRGPGSFAENGAATAYLNLTGAALTAASSASAEWEIAPGPSAATTIATSSSSVFATSSAISDEHRAAAATTTATGLTGTLQASATLMEELIGAGGPYVAPQIIATTSGKVAGTSEDQAKVGFAGNAVFNHLLQGVAFLTSDPVAVDTSAVIAGNTKIAAAFGATASYFALSELGGGHSTAASGTQTVTSSIEDMLTGDEQVSGDLIVGLYGGQLVGTGVTGASFTVYENGTQVLQRKFSNLANAVTYFTNNVLDLGAHPVAGTLDLKIVLTVTSTSANSGFYANMIVGGTDNSVFLAKAAPFAQAMASFGAASSTSTANAPVTHKTSTPLLAIAGHAIA